MTGLNATWLQASWFKNGLLLLVACAFVGFLLSFIPVADVLNQNWVDLHIRNGGWQGALTFLLIGAAATAIGTPRQMIAFLGGYAFGFVEGCWLSTLAATFGCMLSFTFSRVVARTYIRRRFALKIRPVNLFLATQPAIKTIIIRLLPVGNNLVTNLVAGVTQVNALAFISGSFVGYLPQMAIFALMGKGIVVMSIWKVGLSVLLFFISGGLSYRLYQHYKTSRLLDNEAQLSGVNQQH